MVNEQSEEKQCVFCLIAKNKIPSAKLYDDKEVSAFLDIHPATKGHIQVIPKTHAPLISMLNPQTRSKIFEIGFAIGSKTVKKLGAQGVTYLVNEGQGAGQKLSHTSLHVIPRYDGDGVTVDWKKKEWSQEEVNNYIQEIMKKLQSKESQPQQVPHQERRRVAQEKVKKEKKKEEKEPVEIEERIPRYW